MYLTRALGILLLATTTTTKTMADLSLRVVTNNIRYAATGNEYEKPWSVRGPLLIKQLNSTVSSSSSSSSIPIIGMQEVLHAQLVDVNNGLGGSSEWKYIGTGRDDGKEKGEYCPIFYREKDVKLLDSTQKWLSPTPDVPSYWPGAGSRRYVVVGFFEDKASGTRFVAANTHLDNQSVEARREGVRILLGVLRDVLGKWRRDLPVALTGDFNSEPGEGDGDAYAAMVEDGLLHDAYDVAEEKVRFGPYETYTGFVPDKVPEVSSRIDFVWVGGGNSSDTTWDVLRYEVVDNNVDGVYVSDHRSVFADIALKA